MDSEKKKVLIIVNPRAGTMRANKYLTDIAETFILAGYIPTVMVTTKSGDGTEYAAEYAGNYDLMVAVGGDGTFSEVISGIMEKKIDVPVGYIPAGTTNDLATSLGLPKDVVKAAKAITEGSITSIDIGSFNGRIFSYVASFGAFTKTSYATPQSIKNTLGHLAYVLEGVKEGIGTLTSLEGTHMTIDADGKILENNYIFGAVSNSTSIAGIWKLKKEDVDMGDGLFELILIRAPKNLRELAEILNVLTTQKYESEMVTFLSAGSFDFKIDDSGPWTLDGEYQEGIDEIKIENIHGAINMIIGEEKE